MTDVLADKAFMNFSILASKGVGLYVPPKSRKGQAFTQSNTENTKLYANKRIHIERVMSRLKAFRWLSKTVRASQWDLIPDAVAACWFSANFDSPVTDTSSAEFFDFDELMKFDVGRVLINL